MQQHNEPRRILYVEDDEDIREVARLTLEMVGGFEVMLCASGEEALASAAAFGPDIILLDVMMPGMDGPSTLQALRRQPALQHTPVAFMTAKIQPCELNTYREMGAVDVIAKPFDPMVLPEQVSSIWRRSQMA